MDDEERDQPPSAFEEALRQVAQELSRAVERFSELDVDDWVQGLARRVRDQTGWPPSGGGEPGPRDLPTDEQGEALAALDSGRWTLDPETSALMSTGDGPEPADALGLALDLRVHDWLRADGELTLAGRNALTRWLDR